MRNRLSNLGAFGWVLLVWMVVAVFLLILSTISCSTSGPDPVPPVQIEKYPVFVPQPMAEMEPCAAVDLVLWKVDRGEAILNPALVPQAVATDYTVLMEALEECAQKVDAANLARLLVLEERDRILEELNQ